MVRRLVNIASTFYNQAGGDGGPGQMGYITAKSGEMIGKAVLSYWQGSTTKEQVRLAVEAAALAPYEPLQKKLLDFSSHQAQWRPIFVHNIAYTPLEKSTPSLSKFI